MSAHRVHLQIRPSLQGPGMVSLGLIGADTAQGLRDALRDAGFVVGDRVTLVSTVWLEDVLEKLTPSREVSR